MNDRNVEALEVILDELSGEAICERELMIGTLARALAARGVLVPSALDDDECCDLTLGWEHGRNFGKLRRTGPGSDDYSDADHEGADEMRAALERIAKGEDARSRDVADSERGRRAAQDVEETDHLAHRREAPE